MTGQYVKCENCGAPIKPGREYREHIEHCVRDAPPDAVILDLRDRLAAAEARVKELEADVERLRDVYHWSQAVLTAWNIGDLFSGSLLHEKLREVLISYRAAEAAKEKGK